MDNKTIKLEKPLSSSVMTLLRAHHQEMFEHSPPESVHALDESKFAADNITFWGLYIGAELAGCGALQELSAEHVEVKAMRTNSEYFRKGVAADLLEYMIQYAQQKGYQRMSLETGTMTFFAPARAMYKRFGFIECGPFSDYFDDPNSVCMTRLLD